MKPKRATSLKHKKLYSNDEDLLGMKLPPNHIKTNHVHHQYFCFIIP